MERENGIMGNYISEKDEEYNTSFNQAPLSIASLANLSAT